MIKKILLILIFFSIFINTQAEEIKNTQEKIVKVYSSNIWLPKDDFFDGEKIRIYTKFKNENNFDIKQIIEFFDNDILIAEKKVKIVANSEITIWIDKILSFGEHKIISKIKETLKDEIGKEEKIKSPIIENLKILSIDLDTDKDGIGDKKDLDDDNDGISDVEEIKAGSDPKSKLSTPKIEEVKKTISITSEKTKSITNNLLEILTAKRDSFKQQIEKKINQRNEDILEKEKKNKIDKESYDVQEELILIKKEGVKKDFQKNKNIKKNIFNGSKTISDILKKTKIEIDKINNKKLTKEERDFSKACVYQAKYDKISEIQDEENSNSWWNTFTYYLLIILGFVFKNNFLTILFFILLFWMLWKLIKRF